MRRGRQTQIFDNNVYIRANQTIAGPMEGQGNYGDYYDYVLENDEWDCKTHEKSEIKMRKHIIDSLLKQADVSENEIDAIIGGDLLNQIVPTCFSAREFEIPFLGLYEACATFGEALLLGAVLIDGGYCNNVIASVSSHYATAERQYRYPLELGTQPVPTSQWTVTGAGGTMLSNVPMEQAKIKLESCTMGKIVDLGIDNANNMGAAMAPAACDVIITHLKETGRTADYYDLILTGDLGKYGRDVLAYLANTEGYDLTVSLNDCGALIYKNSQKMMQGGSGAGCSGIVFNSYIIKEMIKGNFKRILLVPTGALLSKLSTLQGESIPGIAHAVSVELTEG